MLKGLLVLILLITEESHTDAVCIFNGTRYTEGEVWYPVADRIGVGCVNCTCTNDRVTCKSASCPELKCEVPTYRQGACCPVCEVDPPNGGANGHVKKRCVHNGKTYAHKQSFASNDTALQRTNDKQCVNCVCQSGSVYCHLKTCIIPKNCKTTQRTDDDCCPKCVDPRFRSGDVREESDCLYKEKILKNGSSWNAIDPVKGVEDPCISCTCLNGKTECERELCPVLNCKNGKRKRKGTCCPFCRKKKKGRKGGRRKKNRKNRRKGNKKNRRRKNKNNRGKKKDMKCRKKRRKNNAKRNRRNRKSKCVNTTVTTLQTVHSDPQCAGLYRDVSLTSNGTMPCFLSNLCIPGGTDIIVYRHLFNHTGHLLIAFDDVARGTVEAWTFLRNHTTGNFQTWNVYEGCNADIFRRHVASSTMVLGAARSKIVRKFKRKLGASKSGKERGLRKCISSGKERCKRLLFRQLVCADFEELGTKRKPFGQCS